MHKFQIYMKLDLCRISKGTTFEFDLSVFFEFFWGRPLAKPTFCEFEDANSLVENLDNKKMGAAKLLKVWVCGNAQPDLCVTRNSVQNLVN